MPSRQLKPVLRHLRSLAAPEAGREPSDEQLLSRYVVGRDGEAFAALVRRYGQLVRAVCRRVLRHDQDADDAFQVTFLVFANKAGSIRKAGAVPSWLYGVAFRIAMNARRARKRRGEEQRDCEVRTPEQPVTQAALREVQAILDDEVNRLPQRQRAVFVLCCLEGKSRTEAARQLGWKEGTVSSNIARARKELQRRLARRGVTLSAALCTVEIGRAAANGPIPASLVKGTIKAGLSFARGESPLADLVSAEVATLARGALKSMLTTRPILATCLLAVVLLVAGVGALTHRGLAQPRSDVPRQERAAPRGPRTDRQGDPLPEGALARLGTVRFRHGGSGVAVVAFSGDGKTLVSGSEGGGWVRVWDRSTGKELRHFRLGGELAIHCVALSADGRTFAAAAVPNPGATNHAIHLWDATTGKQLRVLEGHADMVRGLGFSADGKTLASGSGGKDRTVRVWEVATGREIHRFQGDLLGYRSRMSFSPDGKLLAWGGADGAVHVCDLEKGTEVRKLPGLSRTAFSPDGKTVASAGQDTTVRLWDRSTGKELRQLPGHTGGARALTFSPDGATLATRAPDGIRLWETATGKERRRLKGSGGWGPLAFSPDGRSLASGSASTLQLWDVATGQERRSDAGHLGDVFSLAWSSDGKALFSAGDTIRVWEPRTGKELFQLPTRLRGVSAIALASGGKVLAAGGVDGIVICDLESRKEVRLFPQQGRFTLNLALSPDGKVLASEGSDVIHLWDVATGRHLRQFGRASHTLGSFSFSQDGKLLALAGSGTVGLWEVGSGKLLHELEAVQAACSVAFSPDGRVLACAGQNGMVCLWDARTRQKLREFRSHGFGPCCVTFSPDSRALAVGSWDRNVGLWEVATGQERCKFTGHAAGVGCVAFSPDGTSLASGSGDTTILVWDVTGSRSGRGPPAKLAIGDLGALWRDLASPDASKGYQAISRLVAAPEQAVPFLKERFRAETPPASPKRISQLIEELDSREFSARDKASRELEKVGIEAEPGLRRVLTGQTSLELRRRAEGLLKQLEAAEGLRRARALETLERMNSPTARQLLKTLAERVPGSRLSEEAKEACQRLSRRPVDR
jgi:RNA polymerase sigma factor (sigma-70 family)